MRKKFKQLHDGDIRIRKGFLFFPKTINGELRWLEWSTWEEKFWIPTAMASPFAVPHWYPSKWCPDRSERNRDE